MKTLAPFLACCAALAFVTPVQAQAEVSIEVGGSQVRPPIGVDGQAARFFVGGLRASRSWLSGSGISASLLAGRVTDARHGGDFVSGSVSGNAVTRLGGGWSLGVEARGFGFDVTTPFPYRAFGVEGGPELHYASSGLSLELRGRGGLGSSRVEFRRRFVDEVRVVEQDLWRVGAEAELLLGPGPVHFGVAAGVHESPAGRYETGGGRLVWVSRHGAAEERIDRWRTPAGAQTTGGVAFSIPVGWWRLRGFLGRSEPDPLTLAEPGGGGGGVLVGRILYRSEVVADRTRLSPARVLAHGADGARVRLAVTPPDAAGTVTVLGDFSAWEPLAMQRDGDSWTLELDVAPGTYHFGFLVDGEWFVPPDAPDQVSDDWGRTNATLVVEPEGR